MRSQRLAIFSTSFSKTQEAIQKTIKNIFETYEQEAKRRSMEIANSEEALDLEPMPSPHCSPPFSEYFEQLLPKMALNIKLLISSTARNIQCTLLENSPSLPANTCAKLLILKVLIEELNSSIPAQSFGECYPIMLREFLYNSTVLFKLPSSDKTIFQEVEFNSFVGFLRPQTEQGDKPLLGLGQSTSILKIASKWSEDISFIYHLTADQSLYASPNNKRYWATVFLNSFQDTTHVGEVKLADSQPLSFSPKEEKSRCQGFGVGGVFRLLKKKSIGASAAAVKNAIAGIREIQELKHARRPKWDDKTLTDRLNIILFESNERPMNDNEKRTAEHYAIEQIRLEKNIANFQQTFNEYIQHPMIKTMRHPCWDKFVSTFFRKEYYSNAEIAFRAACQSHLLLFDRTKLDDVGKTTYDLLKKEFFKEEVLQRMRGRHITLSQYTTIEMTSFTMQKK